MNMKKSMIALAVASAFVSSAAMAEATVYGQANMAYEIVDDGGDGTGVGTSDTSRNHVASNASRIGAKGSEDLGGGLSAVFQMEAEVGMDTGATTTGQLFNRNTFLGLKSDSMGTVVLGNHDTPYKSSTRGMDVFGDSIADNRSLMGIGHDVRATDVLAYMTPDFGGFSAALAIVGETDNSFGATSPTKTGATSLSAKYGMDNWSAVLGYQSSDTTDAVVPANDSTATATKLGGSYAMDSFSVNAVYEMLSNDVGGTETTQDNLYLAGTYNISDAGKVKLAYTMAGEQDVGGTTTTGSGATQLSLGYDHAMTKNTTLFALYTSVDNDTAAVYGLTSGVSTGGTAAGALTAGGVGDPSAIAFGVKHSF